MRISDPSHPRPSRVSRRACAKTCKPRGPQGPPVVCEHGTVWIWAGPWYWMDEIVGQVYSWMTPSVFTPDLRRQVKDAVAAGDITFPQP